MGDLNNQRQAIKIKSDSSVALTEETIFTEVNARVRDVRVSPRGEICVITDGDNGTIFRVSPK